MPRSRATRAVGVQAGALRVHVAAPPHDGRANAALCSYLAAAAGLRAPAARLRRGSGRARKLVELDGDPGRIAARLLAAVGPEGTGGRR